MTITIADLEASGFAIRSLVRGGIATKRRSDGKAIHIAIQPDGSVWHTALIVTSANQVDRTPTVDAIKVSR